jgi:hypothetical protein
VGILTGSLLKDPDATINYHRNTLTNIAPIIQLAASGGAIGREISRILTEVAP